MNIFTVLLTQPLANGLILFYDLLGQNLGIAIIAFSLFLRIILNPLTKPYMESMKKMRDIAPLVAKLKKKHKDKIKFAKAQSDLYKEKGINPGAGCLPYLLQIVVLIAFFNVFNRVLGSDDPTGKLNELLYSSLKLGGEHVLNTSFLYLDVTKPDVFNVNGLPFPIPGPLLILASIVQFFSAKITQPYEAIQESAAKATETKEDDMQVAMQKSMIYMFPIMTLFIGVKFPAGLALYWFIFSLFQLYIQYKSQGWGGLTPWLNRFGLVKSGNEK